jgi:hypothetical protein
MTKTEVEVITSVQRRRSWSRAEKEPIERKNVTVLFSPDARRESIDLCPAKLARRTGGFAHESDAAR